jgi:hypothetical protein
MGPYEAAQVTMSVGYMPYHLPKWQFDSLPMDSQETRSRSLEGESMATASEPSGELTRRDVCVIDSFLFHSGKHVCNLADVTCKMQNLHCVQLKR